MKKILVTGKNSYIGNSFIEYVKEREKTWQIDKISLRDDTWREKSFKEYDVILHVAGIAHIQNKEIGKDKYREINKNLAIEVARKAKKEAVKYFIFLSSMIVYGESSIKQRNLIINEASEPSPKSFYGKSKLEAENGILKLSEEKFRIAVLRIPFIYGENCKGNFPCLVNLIRKMKLYPRKHNQRSMLYIENLCELLRQMIKKGTKGVFHPQNKEYVETTQLIKQIARETDSQIYFTRLLNPFIYILERMNNSVNKLYGTFLYKKEMSEIDGIEYQIIDFKESIKRSLSKEKRDAI